MLRLLGLLTLGWILGPACNASWEEDGLRVFERTSRSDGDGRAAISFRVQAEEEAMLLTSKAEDGSRMVYVEELIDPSGEVVFDAQTQWVDEPRYKTGGGFPSSAVSFNWPILASDPPLQPGRWRVRLGLVDEDFRYVAQGRLGLQAKLKRDVEWGQGQLRANIFVSDGVADDPELLEGTEEAVAYWQELYAQVGIEVDVEWWSHGGDVVDPPGFGGHADYRDLAAETPLRSVNVVVVEEINSTDPSHVLLGMAGGIPGPLQATGLSAVVVSALMNAGPDMTFDEASVRFFGETMGHEVGHYLGLFHPVEVDFDAWDAISDTEECHDAQTCVDVLGHNLMFPFPVCNSSGCLLQDELTAGQQAVMHRYVGVE